MKLFIIKQSDNYEVQLNRKIAIQSCFLKWISQYIEFIKELIEAAAWYNT